MYAIRRLLLSALVFGTLFSTPNAHAANLRVCQTGDYEKIQDAIDASVSGDVISVCEGTYAETINFLGKNITVRSENGPDMTTIDASGGLSAVTFSSGEGPEALFDGFTVTNGYATYGGGIYITSSSPTVKNCRITRNRGGLGGGIYVGYSSSSITHCTISLNTAWGDGGGLGCSNSNVTITDSTVSGNTAGAKGGGVRCGENSSVLLARCTIEGNKASQDGGGTYLSLSTAEIIGCTIARNFTDWNGGGFYSTASDAALVGCNIAGNSAHLDGGGCYFWYGGSASLINCSVTGNNATGGAGAYCGFPVSITNCTLSGNRADLTGGAIWSPTGTVEVVNSILWDDSPNEIFGSASVAYSNVSGSWPGTGNINAIPEFVDQHPPQEAPTSEGDYHLQQGSPCVDTGTENNAIYPYLPSDDLDGDLRPIDGNGDGVRQFDMGSDELAGMGSVLALDVVVSDRTFGPGDTLTTVVTLTNDSTADTVEARAWLEFPDGRRKTLYHFPSYAVPADARKTVPLLTHTFEGTEPAGEYRLGGRFLDSATGQTLSVDVETILFSPTVSAK